MVIFSQTCDSLVPYFSIDLSAKSDSIWVSPSTPRDGYCCGAISPDKCIEFEVTISPIALGVIVHIYSSYFGAAPFVNYNCSSLTPVEDTIFFPTSGPHSLTLCKPGNTVWIYAIESIPNSITSSSNIEQEDQLIIYPNPTSNFIIIESSTFNSKTYNLIDVSGRIIQSGSFNEQQEIKLESFASGFYIIEVGSEHKLIRQKIIKQ